MRGIIPALLTAYGDDGQFDRERTTALINQLIHDGVHGLFIGGSTGESLLHSVDEREQILATAISAVDKRVDVIAHIGALDTPTTLRLAQFADRTGATALSAVTPIYYALSEQTHANYYRALADTTDLPLIAYHIPSRSGVTLGTDWFLQLAADGVIQGVKYTSTDLYQLAEIRRQTPADFLVYNGSDEVLLGGLALGADGGIGSTYNAIPSVYLRLFEAFNSHDNVSALARQAEANAFIAAMNDYNFLAFLRQVLELRGLRMGTSRQPLPSLSAEQQASVTETFSTNDVLKSLIQTVTTTV